MPLPSSSPILLLLFLLCPMARSYDAEVLEDIEDVFARRACPAFLTFTNVAYLAGVTVELPCHCKPHQIKSVVWFFREHMGSPNETKALTDHHGSKMLDPRSVPDSGDQRSRFSIRLFSLLIFKVRPDDSGLYICGSTNKDFFYAYDLDIQEPRRLSVAPRLTPENASQEMENSTGPGSTQPTYQVFSSFKPWSVCNRCGVPGEQFRVGLCYVLSDFLDVRYRLVNETTASCGSGAVPRVFGLQRGINFGAKLEFKSCQVACETQVPPSSSTRDLMDLLGYIAASQRVSYLRHPAGQVLTMECPGARAYMAVAWDQGSKPIYRSEHSADHDPRLQIDLRYRLVFNPAKTQDSGVYYCWLQGIPTAEIRLLVYPLFGRTVEDVTSHPEFPSAVKTVLKMYFIIMMIFCLLMLSRAVVRHVRDTREMKQKYKYK